MLLVVTIRKEGDRFAYGHISDSNTVRVFCGLWIPSPVLETGLDNPKNPMWVRCRQLLGMSFRVQQWSARGLHRRRSGDRG